MRDFGSYYRDPFHLQQVEVLKGPSSSSSAADRRAASSTSRRRCRRCSPRSGAQLFVGTADTYRVTADIDQPIPALGTGAAFQLSAMGNQNHVAGRDVAQNRAGASRPSIAFGLDGPTAA